MRDEPSDREALDEREEPRAERDDVLAGGAEALDEDDEAWVEPDPGGGFGLDNPVVILGLMMLGAILLLALVALIAL